MPWIIDQNGNKKYKLSDYAKEELPTWAEVYEDFYLNKIFVRDNFIQLEDIDPYWNIKRRLVLVGMICNQFNKMIDEDGYKEELVEQFKLLYPSYYNIDTIQFRFDRKPVAETSSYGELVIIPPPIYSFKNPNGIENPFIISNRNRIFIDDNYDDNVIMEIQITFKYTDNHKKQVLFVSDVFDIDTFNNIIEIMIKPFKEYFENNIG